MRGSYCGGAALWKGKRDPAVDVGQSIAGIDKRGPEDIDGREPRRRKPRIRCFTKGITCLGYMGGNCHVAGHILDT